MSGPPAVQTATNADDSARPAVEVRADGQLLRRIAPGAADALIARGWARWQSNGKRHYLGLTDAAPLSALPGWHGRDGTSPIRADGTGQRGAGQLLGESRSHREHVASYGVLGQPTHDSHHDSAARQSNGPKTLAKRTSDNLPGSQKPGVSR